MFATSKRALRYIVAYRGALLPTNRLSCWAPSMKICAKRDTRACQFGTLGIVFAAYRLKGQVLHASGEEHRTPSLRGHACYAASLLRGGRLCSVKPGCLLSVKNSRRANLMAYLNRLLTWPDREYISPSVYIAICLTTHLLVVYL